MSFLFRTCAVAALALLGACATMSDSPTQQLELHVVHDYREVAGVGCILTNDAGRWYVVAPGRVTVTRSRKPIQVNCKKAGVGTAEELVAARADMNNVVSNAVVTAGIGQLVDRQSGAGYAYPPVLTMLMTAPPQAQAEVRGERAADNRIF